MGAESNGVGVSTTTAPKNCVAIVVEVKIVGAPVDIGIDGGQSGFSKD